MTFTTWVASLFAGVWRVVLTPLDTCKTVLQVEGPKGFASLMKKVSAISRQKRSPQKTFGFKHPAPGLLCSHRTPKHPQSRYGAG